ncbi:MAG: sulfatase [Lentisphaeraceae bacterium]|nr:sulfatase [Lentisphaeraceae bacterium]
MLQKICFILLLCLPVVAADRPNILFIMSDDHTSQAVGVYGSRLAKLNPTPTIDSLAKEGVIMKNAFCTNAICTPSRAAIMTGQYNHVNGVYDLGGTLPMDQQYLAIEMKKAGYNTAMIGKWHLKKEPNYDYYKVLPGQGKYHNPTFKEKGKGAWGKNVVQMQGHSSDCITESTIEWFETKREKDKPFFLMHHYKAPHDMFENAKRYDSYLEDVEIPEPENLWSQPKFGSIATRGHKGGLDKYIGTSIGRRHEYRNYTKNNGPWIKPEGVDEMNDVEAKRAAYQLYLKRYLRCVKGVDDNLAKLFAYLKKEGLYDNTVIVYTGDQGFMLGEHDYMDKRWMYEEAQRMPFIVRYPKGIKAGSVSDTIIENVDFAPMLLDYAGVKTPNYMQGKSFRNIIESGVEPESWKKGAYYRYWMHLAHHWNPGHFGIRTKHFKLIFYYGVDYKEKGQFQTPPAWEFYDLRKDPNENVNQYDNPEYKSVISQLKEDLRKKREEIQDTDDKFPQIKAVVDEFWDYDEADRAKAIELAKEAEKNGLKPIRHRKKK